MAAVETCAKEGTAIDLLEAEDLKLRQLFTALRGARGSSVVERSEYGDIAKQAIRHLATREAALVDVSEVASHDPGLRTCRTTLPEP